jgi:transposase
MSPRQRFRLTDSQKTVILDRHDSGQKSTEIAHSTNIPKSTITSFLARVKKRGSDANPGQPRKTSKTHDHYIRKAQANTKISLAILRAITTSNLSISTIRRRLAESNIKKWRAAKRPRLTVKHVKARLKWARECLEWSEEQFGTVIWSDECSVEKGADPRGVWIFRRPGKHEKYLHQNIAPKNKSLSWSGDTLLAIGWVHWSHITELIQRTHMLLLYTIIFSPSSKYCLMNLWMM